MNSLPQISHHLFAAAAGGPARRPRHAAAAPSGPRFVRGIATELPLELLSSGEAPLRESRPLRVSVVAAGN